MKKLFDQIDEWLVAIGLGVLGFGLLFWDVGLGCGRSAPAEERPHDPSYPIELSSRWIELRPGVRATQAPNGKIVVECVRLAGCECSREGTGE